MTRMRDLMAAAAILAMVGAAPVQATARESAAIEAPAPQAVRYRTVQVDGLDIFYREAGAADAPVIVLLHGFPTSSHMYRDLIPLLATRYRVIAPDYPGYGSSAAPPVGEFEYSFDRLSQVIEGFLGAVEVDRFALFVQDFGGPVGFRIAARNPQRITGIVVQNAVAHEEGLSDAFAPARAFWAKRDAETEAPMRGLLKPETTKAQYLTGSPDPARISPDAWVHAQAGLDRPGNAEIQLSLLHDYQSNPKLYPEWQAYLRKHRPPVLVLWGRGDPFFTPAGAEAYRRDVPDAEVHLFDAGHFALEDNAGRMAELTLEFLGRRGGGR